MAIAGAGALWVRARQPAGLLLAALIGFGVLWSNALAYREVNLAPYEELRELEAIGERIAGDGPTLMTSYQPYGVRHFLRAGDPEGVAELRRRRIPRRDGSLVPKGARADTDELDPGALLVYRTLVLRRSPDQSQPPAPYRLVERGRYYDIWQRPPGDPPDLEWLPLGAALQPATVPRCDRVLEFAEAAGEGSLAYVRRPVNAVAELTNSDHPAAWARAGPALLPDAAGSARFEVSVPADGRWHAWLGGAVRGRIELLIDGRLIGDARHALGYGDYIDLGAALLSAGRHSVELRYSGEDLHPGSAGRPDRLGPLVLARHAPRPEVREAPAAQAAELCGERLDWVVALPG
jgi:hypothetical protein